MKKRLLSLLLCMLMLVSLVPITALAAGPSPYYFGLGKGGKYIAVVMAGGDIYEDMLYYKFSDFGEGYTYETIWPKLTGLVKDGTYKNARMYDPDNGTLYIAGECPRIVFNTTSDGYHDPHRWKIVVGGNGVGATVRNGILACAWLEIELRGDLSLNRYYKSCTQFDECLGAIYVVSNNPRFDKPTLTFTGSGNVGINYGTNTFSNDFLYDRYKPQVVGISCDGGVYVKDNVSLYISSSKFSPMKATFLSIDTSGVVEMTSQKKISDDNYYGIGNLYPLTAKRITLSAPDEYKLLGQVGNKGAVEAIAEAGSIKKALEQDADCKGWNIATGEGNPYTLTLTRPALSVTDFTLEYDGQKISPVGNTYTVTAGSGELRLSAAASIPSMSQRLMDRGLYQTTLSTAAYPVSSLYRLNAEGKPTATVPLTSSGGDRMQLSANIGVGKYMLRLRVAGIIDSQIADVSDWSTYYIDVDPIPKLTGSISFESGVYFGRDVVVKAIDGNVKQLQTENRLQYNWLRWSRVQNDWVTFNTTTENVLPAKYLCEDYLGDWMELGVSVTADGYRGEVYYGPVGVGKAAPFKTPEAPTVNVASPYGSVTVPDSRADQEYIVCYNSSVPSNWSSAKKGSGGDLVLSADLNRTVYVYTRMAETDTMLAGTVYRYGCNYNGEYTGLADIFIGATSLDISKNGVARVNVYPIPSDATGWKDTSVGWYINSYDKDAIKLYEDPGCTKELEKGADGSYIYTTRKTVFAKGLSETANATIGAQITMGYNDMRHAEALMNVADDNGRFRAFSASLLETTLQMKPGESRTVAYSAAPEKGSMYGFSWAMYKDGSAAPISTSTGGSELTFSGTEQSLTVNIPATLPDGAYYFTIIIPNSSLQPRLRVEVGEQNISIEKITADVPELALLPNGTDRIEVYASPNNAKGAADARFKFESGNTAVAAVDQDGTVTAVAPGKTEITIKLIGNEAVSTIVPVTVLSSDPGTQPLPEPDPAPLPEPSTGADTAPTTDPDSTPSLEPDPDPTPDPTPTPTPDPTPTPTPDPTPTPTPDPDPDPDPDPVYPFTDVDYKGRHYHYADAILWAANTGITTGYGNGLFMPDQACTRAQVVTFLWRVSGCPEPKTTENPFPDVNTGKALAPYYKAILWAVENGITTGFDDGSFRPSATCTRAQFVTFLWRFTGKTSVTTTNPFTDVSKNAYYDAIMWAYDSGVTKGYGNGLFMPDRICSRAEVVTFIYRAVT